MAERELEAMFGRALHPVANVQLGRAWRADGVTGYDLTFSAPKSVSALWALGSDGVSGAVRRAHAVAVRAALDYLDEHASLSRTGRDGVTQVGSDGFAEFVEIAESFQDQEVDAGFEQRIDLLAESGAGFGE